jgi:hypothetical protein
MNENNTWENNIEENVKEIWCEVVKNILRAREMVQWEAVVEKVMTFRVL